MKMKKRLSLSLLALIGSVFMFVVASFAWLQVSGVVNIFGPTASVNNVQSEAVIYTSTDGTNYSETESINVATGSPGNSYYFQIVVTNTGTIASTSRVMLYSFTDSLSNPNGTNAGLLAGLSLTQVIRVSTSNNYNADTIQNTLMVDLLPTDTGGDFTTSYLTLLEGIFLEPNETAILYVTFTLDEDTSNDYQNLNLLIGSVSISSVSE